MPSNDDRAPVLALLGERGRGGVLTLKKDGRPQVSTVDFAHDPATGRIRFSTTHDRAKVRNLRRDPRVSLYVTSEDGGAYGVYEGTASLTDVAAAPDDAAVEELVDLYRAVRGEHPDWDEYRRVMVEDGRLVVSFTIDHAYGWGGA
ncbi:PPOX class F420-dependent oxidoreductase [Streptomyces sp. P6-2-1]|uniref:PPOX class F420-dependent oxidoreductase n=1 Tax=unclassified Streptomyces TaxID=2593676 RepID=UPI003D36D49C